MFLQRFLTAALLISTASCDPQSVERTILLNAPLPRVDAQTSAPGAAGSAGSAPGAGGSGGSAPGAGGSAGPVDARIDAFTPRATLPPDRPAGLDAAPGDSAAEDAGAPAQATVSQVAQLVVGDPDTITMGDDQLRIAIESRGLMARIIDDDADVDVTGIRLVVLSGTCSSGALGSRYRDVRVPLLSAEPQAYDRMGMTAGSDDDFGLTQEAMLTIVDPEHVMAAGMEGTIRVVSGFAGLAWGRPSEGAERVAVVQGESDQTAIFGYPAGAMMVTGPAPARRVGFFASDDAAESLRGDGRRLLSAALDWVLLP